MPPAQRLTPSQRLAPSELAREQLTNIRRVVSGCAVHPRRVLTALVISLAGVLAVTLAAGPNAGGYAFLVLAFLAAPEAAWALPRGFTTTSFTRIDVLLGSLAALLAGSFTMAGLVRLGVPWIATFPALWTPMFIAGAAGRTRRVAAPTPGAAMRDLA